ncbi:MAG TPA: universal stress protein [Acidimicrobiales bacterium]|nr:universal stress protein [Acidimicrobiales bacterium]
MSAPLPTPPPGPSRPSRGPSARVRPGNGRSSPKLIGVAVDGNPSGRDATVLGSLLARATGAELMLIAVHVEPLIPVSLPGGMSWTALEKQARTMLAETRDSLAPGARIAVHADVLVWRGLRHVVRQKHRDLLVVGSAQEADPGRVRLGRSARELLGHVECPLAIAPSGFQEHTEKQLDRIGVGFDGTSESRAALDLAVSIASSTGAALEVRSAIDDGVAGGLRTEQIVLEGNTVTERRLISAFERDLAATSGIGVPTNLEVGVGMPTDVLSELCDEVDLLVLGSGHSGPPGCVQPGGTGRGVLRLATCPVLVVPRPAASPRHSR